MANEFVIKNGFHSKGDSNITGSLFVTGSTTITDILKLDNGGGASQTREIQFTDDKARGYIQYAGASFTISTSKAFRLLTTSNNNITLSPNGTGNVLITNGTTQITGSLIISSSNPTQFQIGDSLFHISNAGDIGIGTTSPTARIELKTGHIKLGNNYALKGYGYDNPIIPANTTYGYAQSFQGYNGQVFLGYNGVSYKPTVRFSALGVISGSGLDISGTSTLRNNLNVNGDLDVSGIVTAREFHTEFVSASIVYQSGSTKFGDTSDDVHQFTGSVSVNGAITASGAIKAVGLVQGDYLQFEGYGTVIKQLNSTTHMINNWDGNGNLALSSYPNKKLGLFTDGAYTGTPALVITGSTAAIGTETFQNGYTLSVGGKIYASSEIRSADRVGTTSGTYLSSTSMYAPYPFSLNLYHSSDSTRTQQYWNNDNRYTSIGVGQTSPSASLDVYSEDGNVFLARSLNGGNSLFYISGSGNIGIGTQTPDSLLRLSQTADSSGIKISGFDDRSTSNGLLNIDSNGYFVIQSQGSAQLKPGNTLIHTLSSNGVTIEDGKYFNWKNHFLLKYDTGTSQLQFTDVDSNPILAFEDKGITSDIYFNNELMMISASGEVGIGTITPTRTLDVSGQTRFGQNLGTNDGGWDHVFTVNSGNALAVFKESYASSADRLVTIGNNDNQGSIFILNGSGTPTFYLRSSAASYINNGYNFGIGTTTPSTKLHVNGTISGSSLNVSTNITSSGNIATLGELGVGTLSPGSTEPFSSYTPNANNRYLEVRNIAGSGYRSAVLIRRDDAVVGLDLVSDGGSGHVYISSRYNNDNAKMYFTMKGNGTPVNRMTILGSGNVGIGTESPSTKLHVDGTISGSAFDSAGNIGAAGSVSAIGTLFGGGLDITGKADINGNTTMTGSLNIYKSGSTVFNIEGSQGTLFAVTDSLSGSLFSVNDISGIPIFEVFSDDTVKIGTYNSEAIIVNGSSAIASGSFSGSFQGDGSNLTGIFTLANDANNRIITATGTNSGNGESNFTYDGTTVTVTGGNVDIGRALAVGGITPSGTTGRIDASNDIVAYSSSDKRWKKDIKILSSPIEKLQKLSGVEFDWIEDTELHGNKGHDVGVIAQEVEEVLPEAVQTRDSGMKAVRYEKLIPLLIETIKEQQKQIDELKSKIG